MANPKSFTQTGSELLGSAQYFVKSSDNQYYLGVNNANHIFFQEGRKGLWSIALEQLAAESELTGVRKRELAETFPLIWYETGIANSGSRYVNGVTKIGDTDVQLSLVSSSSIKAEQLLFSVKSDKALLEKMNKKFNEVHVQLTLPPKPYTGSLDGRDSRSLFDELADELNIKRFSEDEEPQVE